MSVLFNFTAMKKSTSEFESKGLHLTAKTVFSQAFYSRGPIVAAKTGPSTKFSVTDHVVRLLITSTQYSWHKTITLMQIVSIIYEVVCDSVRTGVTGGGGGG